MAKIADHVQVEAALKDKFKTLNSEMVEVSTEFQDLINSVLPDEYEQSDE